MTLRPGSQPTATWCRLAEPPPPHPAPRTGVRCRVRKAPLLLFVLLRDTDTDSSGHRLLRPPALPWREVPACRATAPPWGKTQWTPRKPGAECPSVPGDAWAASTCRAPGWASERGWHRAQTPGVLRGAPMRGRVPAAKLRTSERTEHQAQPETDLPRAALSASAPAAGAPGPRIYSFNNKKSHLFIPFREGPRCGHLSGVFSCFPSTCCRPPLMCVPHLSFSPGCVSMATCPHVGVGVSVWVP